MDFYYRIQQGSLESSFSKRKFVMEMHTNLVPDDIVKQAYHMYRHTVFPSPFRILRRTES